MSKLLEWVNKVWKIKIGSSHAVIGSSFKIGGKIYER